MINRERQRKGLPALALDPGLCAVALTHAQDMVENRFFGHYSRRTGTPAARVRRAGYRFTYVGENVAGAESLAAGHQALMASPTHRENILREQFKLVGIAVIPSSPWGLLLVEVFLAPASQSP